jgi:hypothetical protein
MGNCQSAFWFRHWRLLEKTPNPGFSVLAYPLVHAGRARIAVSSNHSSCLQPIQKIRLIALKREVLHLVNQALWSQRLAYKEASVW